MVMVWDRISASGFKDLTEIDGSINAEKSSIDYTAPPGNGVLFQHGNDLDQPSITAKHLIGLPVHQYVSHALPLQSMKSNSEIAVRLRKLQYQKSRFYFKPT